MKVNVQIKSTIYAKEFTLYSLLITIAKHLDPDQARQTLGLIWIQTFDTPMVILKEFLEKVDFEKKSEDGKKA